MSNSLHRLQRRTFLSALGLGISAPLALKMSKLAIAAPAARPVRLFMMFVPHGVPEEHFDPLTKGNVFDLKANGIGGWSPFEPYKQHVTLVRGIGMADGANNHVAIRAALTGFQEGGKVDSIDYVIAKRLDLTPRVLGAIPYKESEGFSVDSHLAKHGGAWVRAVESPIEGAEQLFAGLSSGGTGPDESVFESASIALSAKQVERLKKSVTGLTQEDNKLKVHLEALQGLKVGGDGGPKGCTTRPTLPAVEAVRGINPLDEKQFGKILDAHLEAAANAMVCGSSRVITLQALWVNSNTRFDFAGGPGIAMEHHLGLSHGGKPRDNYAKAQQWIFSRVAEKMLTVLNKPDPMDPAHTVLDNSLIYITTEISDGGNHNSDAGETWVFGQPMYTYLPQMLIGGGGGYLKPGGRVVQVTDKRPHTDVLASLAAAMGVQLTDIGGKPVTPIEDLKA